MMPRTSDSPGDFVTLLQRLVELVVRLVGGRIELAGAQIRDGAARAARVAAFALAGALLAAVALALLALAAVDALAPLVTSRALRFLIVAAPLVAGALVLVRAARAASERRLAGAATDETDGDRDERQHQQHVNPGAERVAAHHAEQPQHQEQGADQPEHSSPPIR
jgi:uncharacterized membrane protein YqjE